MVERRRKKRAEPGGFQSMEYAAKLLENRDAFAERLKDQVKMRKFLFRMEREEPDLGFTDFMHSVKWEASKDAPLVRFYIPHGDRQTRQMIGLSKIVNIRNIGPVAVNFIWARSHDMQDLNTSEKEIYKRVIAHEEEHTKTNIAMRGADRFNFHKQTKKHLESWLWEEITAMAAGESSDRDMYIYVRPKIERCAELMSEKAREKRSPEEIKREYLDKFESKRTAIEDALNHLPKEEVLMVLRKSNWQAIESDLQERIDARNRFTRRRS